MDRDDNGSRDRDLRCAAPLRYHFGFAAGIHPMSGFLLWLLIIAVAIYLIVAMLRPDKF